jgi:ABC-type transport system involved in cytochrome c biogenesis permease subunit
MKIGKIMNKRNRQPSMKFMIPAILAITTLLGIWGNSTLYGQVESLEQFRRIVILENGRKKPLDTFADNMLKQFSGRSRYEKQPAIQWLARVLLTPEDSYSDKIFLITNPEVLDSIAVPSEGKARDRYSFAQLKGGLEKLRQLAIRASKINDKDRSFIENEIMALYNRLYVYQQLMANFDFLQPNVSFSVSHPENRAALQLPEEKKHFSFFDIAEKRDKIQLLLSTMATKEQSQWTEAEKEIAQLNRRLQSWVSFYGELPLTIIPSMENKKEGVEKWLSPWGIARPIISPGNPIPEKLYLLRDILYAYTRGNQTSFDQAVDAFNSAIIDESGDGVRPGAISAELLYNKIDPFYKSKFFFGFSVLFLLLSFVAAKKWFYRLAFILLSAGFLLSLYGVLARMYIRQRPPVTNLYETFIFTGLIAVLLGIILELTGKKNIGTATGGLAGLVMLMIAGKYAMDGDTMGMLVAVLDSNFWLASHVITIILGYAGILLSGFLGHVYVAQRIVKPHKKELLDNTFQAVYAIQAFGLIFTFLGTVLGGIWADQSWGRFWGWDPKENGALLILLWSAILFHAKMAGWIKENGFSIGSVVGVIFVALAWFGVNLLGVGLHSYGFTSGIATALFLFIIAEALFISITAIFINKPQKA